jgi:hypothetical protein
MLLYEQKRHFSIWNKRSVLYVKTHFSIPSLEFGDRRSSQLSYTPNFDLHSALYYPSIGVRGPTSYLISRLLYTKLENYSTHHRRDKGVQTAYNKRPLKKRYRILPAGDLGVYPSFIILQDWGI